MQIDEITDPRALEGLRPEWSALLERCPEASPFQSPEWLLAWWRHLRGGRLRTLAFRKEGRLVALAPLVVRSYFALPLRRICFLGTGATDYLDILAETGAATAAAEAMLEHFSRHRQGWGFVDLQQLPPASRLSGERLADPLRGEARLQEVCPYLPLETAFPDCLPSRMRSNLRYYRRRLERELGEVRFETARQDTLTELLEALFRLHQTRWRRRGLPGCFGGRRVQAFHREAAAGFLARGWLRLHALRIRGEVCAVLYCFVRGMRGYYYGGGFQPSLAAYSPGTLLTGYAIEDAQHHGAAEFDFLRGGERYKYLWGARDRQNRRLLAWHPAFPGSLAPTLVARETAVEHAVKQAAERLARRGV